MIDEAKLAKYGDMPLGDWPEPPDDPEMRRIWDTAHMSREDWNAKYPPQPWTDKEHEQFLRRTMGLDKHEAQILVRAWRASGEATMGGYVAKVMRGLMHLPSRRDDEA